MADIVTKANDTKPQKQGTAVVGVSKQGTSITRGGSNVTGITELNLRWGSRFDFTS